MRLFGLILVLLSLIGLAWFGWLAASRTKFSRRGRQRRSVAKVVDERPLLADRPLAEPGRAMPNADDR
jgi:hypothetical protein